MASPNRTETLLALTRGRSAVDAYVRERTSQEHTWGEESATERLTMAAHPEVRYVAFSRTEEEALGADWLWWFVDASGECVGALVQAKKLTVGPRSFSVDFKHPGGEKNGKQLADLLAAADIFKVPALYTIYCGDLEYRGGERMCPATGLRGDPCERCERASVLLFPGLCAQELLDEYPATAGEAAFTRGVALEDAIDPDMPTAEVEEPFKSLMGQEFAEFLERPQTGARDIAKMMFKTVNETREQILPKFQKNWIDLGPDAVFPKVFSRIENPALAQPTLPHEHILRGLRRRLPAYVAEVMNGGRLPDQYLPYLAGMIVVPV